MYLSVSNANTVRGVKCCRVTYCVESISRFICVRCGSHHNEITVWSLFDSTAKVVDIGINFTIPERFPGVKYNITAGIFYIHWSLIWEFLAAYAQRELYGESNKRRIEAVQIGLKNEVNLSNSKALSFVLIAHLIRPIILALSLKRENDNPRCFFFNTPRKDDE